MGTFVRACGRTEDVAHDSDDEDESSWAPSRASPHMNVARQPHILFPSVQQLRLLCGAAVTDARLHLESDGTIRWSKHTRVRLPNGATGTLSRIKGDEPPPRWEDLPAPNDGVPTVVEGCKVILVGLGRRELNGCQGVCGAFDAASGRFAVAVTSRQQALAVRPVNLWRCFVPAASMLSQEGGGGKRQLVRLDSGGGSSGRQQQLVSVSLSHLAQGETEMLRPPTPLVTRVSTTAHVLTACSLPAPRSSDTTMVLPAHRQDVGSLCGGSGQGLAAEGRLRGR